MFLFVFSYKCCKLVLIQFTSVLYDKSDGFIMLLNLMKSNYHHLTIVISNILDNVVKKNKVSKQRIFNQFSVKKDQPLISELIFKDVVGDGPTPAKN